MKKKNIVKAAFLVVLIVASVAIIWQQRSTPYQHDTGFIFGTTYSITYQYAKDLQPEIEAEMKRWTPRCRRSTSRASSPP